MASYFQQVFTLLTTNPGNLVYHLLLTFSIAGALPASLTLWRDAEHPIARRMLIGLSVLLVLRLALFIISALAWAGILQNQLLAPLERAVSLFSLVLIIWLWAFPDTLRQADAATLLLGFLSLTYFMLSLVWWDSQPSTVHFNGSWPDLLGSLLSLGALLLGGLILWRRSPQNWGLGLAMLLLLFLGDLAQLLAPLLDSDYPGALRLAQMAAYPILLTLPQRFSALPGTSPAASPGTALPTADPPFFQASLALAAETSLDKIYLGITRILSQAMAADACLIAFPLEGRDQLNVLCGYNQVTKTEIPPAQVDGPLASSVCNALRRSRPLRLPASSTVDGLPGLAGALGGDRVGPLLAVPLPQFTLSAALSPALSQAERLALSPVEGAVEGHVEGKVERHVEGVSLSVVEGPALSRAVGSVEGGVILVSPSSSRSWTAADQALLARWVETLTPLLNPAQPAGGLAGDLAHTPEELETLHRQVEQAAQDKKALLTRLETLQFQAEQEHARSQGLAGVVASQEDAMATIARLEAEIKTLHALRTVERPALSRSPKPVEGKVEGRALSAVEGAANAQASEELRLALQEVASLKAQLGQTERQVEQMESRPVDYTVPADQGEIIASIAQELRQPMSSIVGYTDLLLGESVGILGALQRKFLERVKASTERMGSLVDDLIQVSTSTNQHIDLSPEPVDLNALIDEAVALSMGQLREKNILLRVDIPDQLPSIIADKDSMQQIFIHLLQNAGSASQMEGEISIRALLKKEDSQQDFILLQVADSGAGIAPEDLSRVFSRLYRADNALIQGVGDTGVGLSIVKTLVEAHGGRIWVDSVVGKGSTFSILLPLTLVEVEEEPTNE